jgi:hypothetical protein
MMIILKKLFVLFVEVGPQIALASAKVLIDMTGTTSCFPMSLLSNFTICYWIVLSSVLSVSGLTSTLIDE